MKYLNNFIPTLIILLVFSCGSKTNNKEAATLDRDEIRLKQYRVKGSQIYKQICANCHQQDGTGLAGLFPPLAKADYLTGDLERAACIIKNGMIGEIVVNGTRYNQMMPANKQLTPLEVAEVLTFITNAWGNDKGLTSVKEVERWLANCDE